MKTARKVILIYVQVMALIEVPDGWSVPPSSGTCGAISFVYVEDGAKKEKVESVSAVKKKKKLSKKFRVANVDASGIWRGPVRTCCFVLLRTDFSV